MAQLTEEQMAIVNPRIEMIKQHMPNVYKAIKARADVVGNSAYTLVRRGLLGEPDCFFAFEGGRVVGTPFGKTDIMDVIAVSMVRFGCAHVCIFDMSEGGTDGTH